jgi:hypothetical protein
MYVLYYYKHIVTHDGDEYVLMQFKGNVGMLYLHEGTCLGRSSLFSVSQSPSPLLLRLRCCPRPVVEVPLAVA